MNSLCLFDDSLADRFQPLTLTRPAGDLRVGIFTIAEKWRHYFKTDNLRYNSKPWFSGIFPSERADNINSELWINSRYLPDRKLAEAIRKLELNSGLTDGSHTIVARLSSAASKKIDSFHDLSLNEIINYEEYEGAIPLKRLWELFLRNGEEIISDLDFIMETKNFLDALPDSITTSNREQIFIHQQAEIEPGSIFIADEGPIYIGESAHIQAGSLIRGPVAICDDAVIKMGAKIYGKTTIGPVCKVGGEVNNCIFHSYSNKGHDGFTGNSLFGQWCNLGADTNTSNLKNNYSTIRLTDFSSGDKIESGQQFIGTIMGDHSKTSINTMLNTGTVCGVSPSSFHPSAGWEALWKFTGLIKL